VKDPSEIPSARRDGITRGTTPGEATTEKVDPATALWLGVKEPGSYYQTLSYIGMFLLVAQVPTDRRSRFGIAQISGQVATLGLTPCFTLRRSFHLIGLLNLFPVMCAYLLDAVTSVLCR